MTVKEIVQDYLKQNGFDGLFNPNECACLIDDLFPCYECFDYCQPGYKGPCDCGDHDWHVEPDKPAAGGEQDAD